MGRLSATAVKAAKQPGRYGDGDGLYLLVGPTGGRSWICRVQKDGKRRDIGLGSAKKVSLAQARERAAKVRSQIEAGLDPISERRKAAGIPTFREAAVIVFDENKKNWRNAKHRDQWLSSLTQYAFPHFGDMAVSKIDGPHVRDALVAIWLDKPETARRVRQRIVMVIDWAVAKGYPRACRWHSFHSEPSGNPAHGDDRHDRQRQDHGLAPVARRDRGARRSRAGL